MGWLLAFEVTTYIDRLGMLLLEKHYHVLGTIERIGMLLSSKRLEALLSAVESVVASLNFEVP